MLIYLTILLFLLPLYVYIGYPVLLFLIRTVYTRKHIINETITPNVTLIVSCFNESDVIRDKINNSLEIDYPDDHLEILFV